MKLTDIRAAAQIHFTTRIIPDLTWDALIARAARYYSRFNPVVAETTFDTVVGQTDYSVIAGCEVVRDVEWWPGGSLTFIAGAVVSAEAALMSGSPVTRTGSELLDQVLYNIDQDTRARVARGYWTMFGTKIRILPAPTSVQTVTYVYHASHALTVLTGDYATIPDRDFDIIVDLTRAELVLDTLVEYSIEPDFAEGDQRENRSNIAVTAHRAVERLRASVAERYGGAQCAMLS